MSIELVAVLLALVFAVLGVRVVRDHERLGVLRLGRFIGVRGPGIVLIIPFVDKADRVDLDRNVPGWRSMSGAQLVMEIERRVAPAPADRGGSGPR